MNETIVAISTPLQEGAISIVRMSGDEAIAILNRLFSRDISQAKSHTVHYGTIRDFDGNDVDEVLVSIFRAPRTYTREDVVEINCHGSVFVTRKILSLCIAAGARPAHAGEFTQRAFLNGRIDLSQAEAVNALIQSDNNQTATISLKGVKGSVRKLIDPLIDELVQIIAQIEVNIDYPEYEDVEELTDETLLPMAEKLLKQLEDVVARAEDTRLISKGINTIILGKPNVGKSSLLNALLEEEKAIVTDIAGTTRDLVEGVVRLKNVTLRLIDTAGIRDTEDTVEMIGIQKSKEALKQADLVLVLLDASRPLDTEDEEILEMTKDYNRILVYNKADLNQQADGLKISALEKEVGALIAEIETRFEQQRLSAQNPSLNNDRQIGCALAATQAMKDAISAMKSHVETDLVTLDLQKCYHQLKQIIGESSQEDLLDELFSRFCLGK